MTLIMLRAAARARMLFSLLLVMALAIPALAGGRPGGGGDVYVRGYTRSNGTYVEPHYRSHPDGDFYNNWSTKGNVNPYTGMPGTKVTPPIRYGSSYGASYGGSTDYWSTEAVRHRAEIEEGRRKLDAAFDAYRAQQQSAPAAPAVAPTSQSWIENNIDKLDTVGARAFALTPGQGFYVEPLRVPVFNKTGSSVTAIRFKVVFFADGTKIEERLVEGYSPGKEWTRGCYPLPTGSWAPFLIKTPACPGATSMAVYVEAWQ